jgi:Ner family transcriptional regulator
MALNTFRSGPIQESSLNAPLLALFAPFSKENFRRMTVGPDPGKVDWHPADVLAALKKRGKTLSGLSRDHGYHATAAGKALKQSWPALEALIASELGLAPEAIWPSRYAPSRQRR